MKRANHPITDLKWNTKKNLASLRRKAEKIAYAWGDVDFFIVGQMQELITKIDEIEKEIASIEPGKF